MRRSKKRMAEIDACIRRRYPNEQTRVIADILGESVNYINDRARQIGVRKDRGRISDHDDYIREHYAADDVTEIAKHIGYHVKYVYAHARALGLTRPAAALSREQRSETARKAHCRRKAKRVNQNPVTSATETSVCSAVIRGETVEQYALETERSLEQVQEVLERCKASGKYDAIRRHMAGVGDYYGQDHSAGRLCSGGQ